MGNGHEGLLGWRPIMTEPVRCGRSPIENTQPRSIRGLGRRLGELVGDVGNLWFVGLL